MTARRWVAIAVIAVGLAGVLWVLRPSAQDGADQGTIEHFCGGLTVDVARIGDQLAELGPGAPPDLYPSRELRIETLQLLYSTRWVAGAPTALRSSAEALHEGIERLADHPPNDDEVARLVQLILQLREGAEGSCG